MIYLIENIELLSQLPIDAGPQIVKGTAALVTAAAVSAGAALLKTGINAIGIGRKKRERKRKAKELEKQMSKVENFEFTNAWEGLEGTSYETVAGELGELGDAAQLGQAGKAELGTLGRARGYSARGYEGEGYESQGYTAGQTNIAGLARGAATGLTNTMSNLQVSTAGAEMAAREADQSLAASQDLAAQAGTGAGGATALAAAAAKSKAGIAADIDKQVKQNEMMRAQGESELQRAQLAQGNLASQFDLGQSQFNVGAANQAAQFGAAAANQAAQFGADARNQANRFTADAMNQAARFKAQAQNQFALTQFGAENALSQFNVGAQNQFAMADVAAQNQFGLAQFGAENQMNQFNAGQQTAANRFAAESAYDADVRTRGGAEAMQNNQYSKEIALLNARGGQSAAADAAYNNQSASVRGAAGGVVDAIADSKWAQKGFKN